MSGKSLKCNDRYVVILIWKNCEKKKNDTFLLKKYDEESIYIIGGESIYRQMLPYCNVAHVTKIDHAYEADAYFPDLDSNPDWEITADSDEQVYFDITYRFLKYERKMS